MDNPLFADIIIPVAAPGTFTYSVASVHRDIIRKGSRVVVQFGAKRLYSGVVTAIHSNPPAMPGVKEIIDVAGKGSFIDNRQFKLWNWMADYYMCTMGEVMDASLPSGFKIESRTIISLVSADAGGVKMSNAEEMICRILEREGSITLDKLPDIVDGSPLLKVVSGMVESGILVAGERAFERFKPKEQSLVSVDNRIKGSELHDILDSLARSPARLRLLNTYLEMISYEEGDEFTEVSRNDLLRRAATTAGPLNELVNRSVFRIRMAEISRLTGNAVDKIAPHRLSNGQQDSLDKINNLFTDRDVVLLKGVTSSGKTEIYIHLINEAIKKGRQALFLLPEIALTSQMINRLKRHFGDMVGVYHSGFSDNERVEVWKRTAGTHDNIRYRVILGVRSSIFLPFKELGIVIVDEEHENSYKQQDPAPRYNARDCAIMLAKFHNAKTLLGSATPSVESMHNAITGKYGLVELNERYGEVKMPEMILADTRDAYRRKIMISHFTPRLVKAIEEALDKNEQVVLFRNRRGYAPVIQCRECGWVPGCRSCSVNLTYHKVTSRMKCHYCGYSERVPSKCSACGSTDIVMKGFGTEKIEDELAMLFPGARISRMDLDTTRRKGSVDRIISELELGKTDILIGTQMISKGLDFENLTVVGILNIDNMLHFPDFRSHEKCFQMIEQVSGRAGRRQKQGKVVVQTFDPSHSVMIQALHHNYDSMFETQIEERREFNYPPFSRLIKLYVRNRDRGRVVDCATHLAAELRKSFGKRVLGPEFPSLSRLQNFYIMSVIIKVERDKPVGKAKKIIGEITTAITNSGLWPGSRIYADVDPL